MNRFRQLLNTMAGPLMGGLIVLAVGTWQPQSWAQAASTAVSLPGASSGVHTNGDVCNTGRSIRVTGAAAVNVAPDRALIKLGVQSNAQTPDGVQAMNTRTIRQVIDAVRALGVADKDISTDNYVVYPVYYDYNSLRIKGYRIDNVVAITLKDVSRAGDVVVAAFNAGANEVVDVQFYTSELRRYRDQARELAMTAAVEKAQALAKAGGTETGCVMQISENSWSYYNGWWGSRRGDQSMMTQNVVQNAAPNSGSGDQTGSDEGPISQGQIVVRAQIDANFSLK
jgi:uncharacterized protein YggE